MIEDIGTIQKINQTSRELKNFGFSDSTQDSIAQAQNLYLSDDESKASVVFGSGQESMDALQYNFKKFRESTDIRIRKMGEEIQTLQQYVKQLLNSKTQSPQTPQRAETKTVEFSQPHISPERRDEPVREERPEPPKQEQKPYNERQGSFTSNDVKIEDIFYCGNK